MFQVGLDLGTNSIGWAIVSYDEHVASDGPVAAGSYVFPEAGDEEGGKFVSHRRKRGAKRRQRKQLRRKRQRRNAVLRLLVAAGLIPKHPTERVRTLTSTCPYRARAEALDRRLEPHELGCAIYHLAKRRGYLSTAALKLIGVPRVEELDARLAAKALKELETDAEDRSEDDQEAIKELKGALKSIAQTRKRLEQGEARTLGELLFKEIQDKRPVRAITGKRITQPVENALSSALGEKKWSEMRAKDRRRVVEKLKRIAELSKQQRSELDEKRLQKLFDELSSKTNLNSDALSSIADSVRQPVMGIRADRKMYQDEFNQIINAQRAHHPEVLTEDFCNALREALFYQRPLKPTSDLIGFCSILPQRKRCHNATMLAQHSIILQRLNTLRIDEKTEDGPVERRLTPREIGLLVDALDHNEKLSWEDATKIINLRKGEQWFDEMPPEEAPPQKGGKRKKGRDGLVGNQTCAAMRGAIGDAWDRLTNRRKEELIHRILTAKHFKDIVPGLRRDYGFSDEQIYYIATAKLPEGHNRHCAKVLRKIEPFLREGHVYSEALELAGLREPHKSTEDRPDVDTAPEYASTTVQIANPVVQRAVKNALIVLNAIIKKHGKKPDVVRVELPRDVSRTNKQRERVIEAQKRRKRHNEEAEKLLKDSGLPTTSSNIRKVRLWQEAGCCSPYDPETKLTIRQVIEECDIDHIIPRSRSLDDSYMNLTICPNQLNLVKGDKTPYEAFGTDSDRWRKIKAHLNALKSMGRRKKALILTENPETDGFVGRDFSDTSYIAREVMKAIKAIGVEVQVTRGALTAELRKLWRLDELLPLSDEERKRIQDANEKGRFKSRDDHRHHALDAVITALMNPDTHQCLTQYYKRRETEPKKGISLPEPWPGFKEDLKRVIDEAPVVFQPTRGIGGPLHEETARTPPSREEIQRAIAQLPVHRRDRIDRAVVVGSQLVRLDERGEPLAAYDLGSNHHCIIWQQKSRDKKGRFKREIEVVSMIEAATRACCGEPVFSAKHSARGDDWEPFLFLCKNDIVEYDHPEEGRKRMRVAKFSSWAFRREGKKKMIEGVRAELVLRPVLDAREIKQHNVRVRGQEALARILHRVILSPLGDVVGLEPRDAEH